MEIYDTIESEENYAMESLEKTKETLSETYDDLQATYPKGDKSKVSKCACITLQKCMLLLFATMGVVLSLASLGFTILEKVKAVDGSWSAWESWEACSITCDVGMQRRQRNCSNPAPLGNGRQCLGVDIEHKLCFPGPCSNGGWSYWSSWGQCSASCNGGIRSRSRSCTSPVPSLAGRHCEGNQSETVSCNNTACKAPVIVFHASNATGILNTWYQEVVFKDIKINEGDSYNSTTGVFTAPVSGIYQFSVHLCEKKGKVIEYSLIHQNYFVLRGHYSEYDGSGTCTSFSLPLVVKQSEIVYVINEDTSTISDILYQDSDDWNTFSGVLVQQLN